MKYRIKDLPQSERPRERLKKHGVKALSTSELLAIILRTGSRQYNVKQLATQLLNDMGIKRLQNAHLEELKQYHGLGEVKAGQLAAAFELINRLEKPEQQNITSFQQASELFQTRMHGLEQEELHAVFLTSSNKVKAVEQVFKGSLESVSVHSRDIVRKALRLNASAVIIAHNHPDGNAQPTKADINATHDIRKGLEQFDIKLLDHIILGDDTCSSLKKIGCI